MKQKQLFHSRDVIFDESKFGIQEAKVPATEKEVPVTCVSDTEDEVQEALDIPAVPAAGRPVQMPRAPDRYGEWVNLMENPAEPGTVSVAMGNPEKQKWQIAMEKEMKSLQDHHVWDLVDLPEHINFA